MFHIDLEINGINIVSVEETDLNDVYQFIIDEDIFFDSTYFYERFLEYYLSECEFFLKINRYDQLVGIIKGRVEFKNPNQVWLSYFLLDNKLRNRGMGSTILKNLVTYFINECGIVNFYVNVKKTDFGTLDFWFNNRFSTLGFYYDINDKNIILKNCISNGKFSV